VMLVNSQCHRNSLKVRVNRYVGDRHAKRLKSHQSLADASKTDTLANSDPKVNSNVGAD
jgi:hypothetical protein